jgi:hypothetical protein
VSEFALRWPVGVWIDRYVCVALPHEHLTC